MLRIIAILFGIAFIFAGVAGNLPMFMHDGMLFGYFSVNSLQKYYSSYHRCVGYYGGNWSQLY